MVQVEIKTEGGTLVKEYETYMAIPCIGAEVWLSPRDSCEEKRYEYEVIRQTWYDEHSTTIVVRRTN